MVELRRRQQESNEVIDEVTICNQVLGSERNGYIPGLGPNPDKKQLANSSHNEAQINQRLGDMAAQMRVDIQRERDDIRQQVRTEIIEDVRKEQQEMLRQLADLLNIPNEHSFFSLLSMHQPPPPPPPPAPAA